MKHILVSAILLIACARSFAQDVKDLGRTYEEVREHNKLLGGVKTPKTDIDTGGYKQLFYDCTDDRGMGLLFFNYSFKNNVCIAVCIGVRSKLETLQSFYNKKYQYDEDAKVWYDNVNNIAVSVTGFNDFYTVWFQPKKQK